MGQQWDATLLQIVGRHKALPLLARASDCSLDGVKRNPGCIYNDEHVPGLRFASSGLSHILVIPAKAGIQRLRVQTGHIGNT